MALFALHNTLCPNIGQNNKLINVECRPNHEECKLEIITCKQQNNTKT
jgi:hypothetical protein